MLLVDDDKAEVVPLYLIFQKRVRTYEDVYRTVHQTVVDRYAVLRRGGTGEQGNVDSVAKGREKGFECLVVLVGEYLGGRHDTSLIAVVDSQQAAE